MNELTQRGIAALKSGDRAAARQFLTNAVMQDSNDVTAWLWLTGALDNDDDRIACLRQVLRIDPGNQAAARGLAQILERRTRPVPPKESQAAPEPEPAPQAVEPAPASAASPMQPAAQAAAAQAPVEQAVGAQVYEAIPPQPIEELRQIAAESAPAAAEPAAEEPASLPAEQPFTAPEPPRRRARRSPSNSETRLVFRARPSLVPALACFWLFLIGPLAIVSLLTPSLPDISVMLGAGLCLILELIVVYTIIRNVAVRYELTNQQLTLRFRGKRARIAIPDIFNAECNQTFFQRLIGIGDINIDATVNGQLAQLRIRNIPQCRLRTDQIMYLVRDYAAS